jgi:hypothetical protein
MTGSCEINFRIYMLSVQTHRQSIFTEVNVLLSILLSLKSSALPLSSSHVHTIRKSKYIHTSTHALFPKGQQRHLRFYFETPTFYQNYLAMSNTADVTGKPIAIWSQSISGLSVMNPLVAFYDMHGRKEKIKIIITTWLKKNNHRRNKLG